MEGKPQARLQEVKAVAHYCATPPTGSNTTTGQIRRTFKVLEEIHYGTQWNGV